MLDDEAAFTAAILEQPDDDTPRLVFADWLDDRMEDEAGGFYFAVGKTGSRRYPTREAAVDALATVVAGMGQKRIARHAHHQ